MLSLAREEDSRRTRGFQCRYVTSLYSVKDLSSRTFSEVKHKEPGLSEEVVEEGTRIVEDLLRAWTANSAQMDDEDTVMADDDEPDAATQLAELKVIFERFQPRLEGNTWVQSVLASL